MATRILYFENKATGAAWIGRGRFSRTFQTVYYRDLMLHRIPGRGIRGNFLDPATNEEYWVSGPKKRGGDAHPAERGVDIFIDEDVRKEYWTTIRGL